MIFQLERISIGCPFKFDFKTELLSLKARLDEWRVVVSIGRFTAFYVVLVPLEYIATITPHSTYVIVLLRKIHRRKYLQKLFSLLNIIVLPVEQHARSFWFKPCISVNSYFKIMLKLLDNERLNKRLKLKHIPLSSQRSFHFLCSIGTLFHSDQTK